MFAPGARHGPVPFHPRPSVLLIALGLLVFAGCMVVLATRVPVTGSWSGATATSNAGRFHTAAYIAPAGPDDVLYLREARPGSLPRVVTAFPRPLSLRARGLASPLGDRVAVLHLSSAAALPAALTIVTLPQGATLAVPGGFDYLSGIAWSPSGLRVAVVRTSQDASGARQRITVIEVDSVTGATTEGARFDGAHQAVPVGYSPDGRQLYVAVIDQSGSTLWVTQGARAERVASLSAGPTRDWSLSPDAVHLAFVDRLGVGERRFAARVLSIPDRTLADPHLEGDQVGAAWRPGSHYVDFGGPGGSVRLTDPAGGEDYVIPLRWSPDGSLMAVTIYGLPRDNASEPSEFAEIVTEDWRLRLSEEPGARFLGFVRDP